jgi:hypothetical protein
MPRHRIHTATELTPELRKTLERIAKDQHRSLSNLMSMVLQTFVENQSGPTERPGKRAAAA